MDKEAFTRKIPLLTTKLRRGRNWLDVRFGALNYKAQNLDTKKIRVEVFGEL